MVDKIKQWLESNNFDGFDNQWYGFVSQLIHSRQILFMRKVVEAHRLGFASITIPQLSTIVSNRNNLEIDVYILTQCLLSVLENKRLPYVWEIYNTIRNIYEAYKVDEFEFLFNKFANSPLFDTCTGFTHIRKKPDDINVYGNIPIATLKINEDKSCELTYNENIEYVRFSNSVARLKCISGRKYNPDTKMWSIPASSIDEVVDFLRNSVIGRKYKEQHLIEIKYLYHKYAQTGEEKPFIALMCYSESFNEGRKDEIHFCEGKKWMYPHFGHCFWCGGSSVFCKGLHSHDNYAEYTLYDMLKIINNGDDCLLQQSYSGYNRLKRLVSRKHLQCKSCNMMIEPLKDKSDNGYNARRVVYFHCSNIGCTNNDKIYLTHCFQEFCGGIIDSRETQRCSNGFYICKKCGVCCAESQFQRKIDLNIPLGDYISGLIKQHKMHLDSREPKFFCPTCRHALEYITLDNPLTIVSRDERIVIDGYHRCPNHKEYFGVFPRDCSNQSKNDFLAKFICPICGASLEQKKITDPSNKKVIQYQQCVEHVEHYGIFPKSPMNKKDNERLKELKKCTVHEVEYW